MEGSACDSAWWGAGEKAFWSGSPPKHSWKHASFKTSPVCPATAWLWAGPQKKVCRNPPAILPAWTIPSAAAVPAAAAQRLPLPAAPDPRSPLGMWMRICSSGTFALTGTALLGQCSAVGGPTHCRGTRSCVFGLEVDKTFVLELGGRWGEQCRGSPSVAGRSDSRACFALWLSGLRRCCFPKACWSLRAPLGLCNTGAKQQWRLLIWL